MSPTHFPSIHRISMKLYQVVAHTIVSTDNSRCDKDDPIKENSEKISHSQDQILKFRETECLQTVEMEYFTLSVSSY